MPNEILTKSGTAKTWRDTGGDAAITLASVANAAARQGAKLDLGATRGGLYSVDVDLEFAATPTAGNTVDLYWSPSSSATAGTDNRGGASGTDAAYTGTAASTIAESVRQLQYMGTFVCTDDATTAVQSAHCGFFKPAARYGSPVLVNNSGAAIHSDDANCKIVLTPVIDEVQ